MNTAKKSISLEEFKTWLTGPERILEFLKYSKKAFTPQGIAIALKMKNGDVGALLNKLKEKRLVVNRQPYWAFNFKK